jgi:hypothetical protein
MGIFPSTFALIDSSWKREWRADLLEYLHEMNSSGCNESLRVCLPFPPLRGVRVVPKNFDTTLSNAFQVLSAIMDQPPTHLSNIPHVPLCSCSLMDGCPKLFCSVLCLSAQYLWADASPVTWMAGSLYFPVRPSTSSPSLS